MVGSELAPYPEFLLGRARSEFDISPRVGPFSMKLASLYLAIFGIPEIGLHLRTKRALSVGRPLGDVADIGCGAGMLIGQLHRRATGRIVGIDPDASSYAIASKAHPYAEFVQADLLSIAHRFSEAFDTVFSLDMLQYVSDGDLPQFFSACQRILRPGGKLVVHVPAVKPFRHLRRFDGWTQHGYERNGITPEQLTTLLAASGFERFDVKRTIGAGAALAWELNMLAIATPPLGAIAFPFLLGAALVADQFRSRVHNAIICVAWRR